MILYLCCSSTGRRCGILFHSELRLDIDVMSIVIMVIAILLRKLLMLLDAHQLILVFLQDRLHSRVTVILRRDLLAEVTRLRCDHFALVRVVPFRAGSLHLLSLGAATAAGLASVVLLDEKG